MQNYNTVEKCYSDNNVFCNYKVTLTDNTIIDVPLDQKNEQYQEIQEWISEGNTVIDNPPE